MVSEYATRFTHPEFVKWSTILHNSFAANFVNSFARCC
ncbi:MAG: hypothetical protein PWP09_1606, partial [Thermotogota bacterium]|nr:hypothetical protein [Thermotogota bacterium]